MIYLFAACHFIHDISKRCSVRVMEAVQQQTGVWRNDDAHLAECAKSKCSGENACCKSDFVWVDCSFFRFLTFILPEYFILPCVKTLSTFLLRSTNSALLIWDQFIQHLFTEPNTFEKRLFVSQLLQDYPIQSDGMTARLSLFHAVIITIIMTILTTQFDWQVIYVKWCAEKQQQRMLCMKIGDKKSE